MVKGLVAILLLTTSTPSLIKIEVMPVSAIACVVTMVITLRYLLDAFPKNVCAVAAIVCVVTKGIDGAMA
jgi:hypothetical protein